MNIEGGWNLSIVSERVGAFSHCLDLNASPTYMPTPQTTVRAKDAAMILKITRELKEAADKSLIIALQTAPQVEDEVSNLGEKNYPATTLFLVGLPGMPRVVARQAAIRDTANLLLVCEQYRRKYGRWPAALDLLVPDFLGAVPLDPFSTLPYKIAMTKEEFKVYSFGDDKLDNGGNLVNDRLISESDLGFALPIVQR